MACTSEHRRPFAPRTKPSTPTHPTTLQLYTLALSKHAVFRTDTRPDVRAAAMWHMLSLPVQRAVPLVYARMVPLHGLLERPQVRLEEGVEADVCVAALAGQQQPWKQTALANRVCGSCRAVSRCPQLCSVHLQCFHAPPRPNPRPRCLCPTSCGCLRRSWSPRACTCWR